MLPLETLYVCMYQLPNFICLLALVRMSAKAHFCMDKNDQFVFVHHAGTNHTHHPTDVSHLEDMVGGTTLERVSGSQFVGG